VVPVVDPPELPADPKAAKKQQQQQHHRSSTAKQPDTAKKHWDPTSLFPK
jgi:hypothetical protein